jgi:hypothetical protein
MGTQRGQMTGVLPWLVHLACRTGTRDFCSDLAALAEEYKTFLFLTVHYLHYFVPIAQQAAGQAGMQEAGLGRLPHKGVCIWLKSAELQLQIPPPPPEKIHIIQHPDPPQS